MPELSGPIRLENGYGCYCPDCAGSWPQADKSIKLCGCPCHEEEDEDTTGRDGAEEWMHDNTCDCDSCCEDEEEMEHRESGPVPGCNCHDCIR